MAGGGVKPGFIYGATDEFGYHAVENRMHIHDLHATMLHMLGLAARQAHVPVRGPRFPSHRRRRHSTQRDLRMRLLAVVALFAVAAIGAQTPDTEFFEKRVRPLFASKCYGCHGDKVQMGGLRLSSAAGLTHAFESGVIAKSDPEKSRLYRALSLLRSGENASDRQARRGRDCGRTYLDREWSALPQPPSTISKARAASPRKIAIIGHSAPSRPSSLPALKLAESDRSVHPRKATGEGHSACSSRPETDASSARNLRPYGPAANQRRDQQTS